MGLEKHVKITPYLRIICPKKQEERKIAIQCCQYKDTVKNNFCPKCGKAIQFNTLSGPVDAINQSAISESIDEALCYLKTKDGDFDIWHPNAEGIVSTDQEGVQEIPKSSIKYAVEFFSEKYESAISIIEAYYGTSGQIHFGLLVWWS